MTRFSHYDLRQADTYVIELDDFGQFLRALRYLAQSGRDPITYEDLADLPPESRSAVEQKIYQLTR